MSDQTIDATNTVAAAQPTAQREPAPADVAPAPAPLAKATDTDPDDIDEAAELAAEQHAEALRAIVGQSEATVDDVQSAAANDSSATKGAEAALFEITDEVLHHVYGALPMPEPGEIVTLIVQPDTIRFVLNKAGLWWIDIPNKTTTVEAGQSVVIAVEARFFGMVGKLFNPDHLTQTLEARFEAAKEVLWMRAFEHGECRLQVPVPAKAVAMPALPMDAGPADKFGPLQPRALRRLLAFVEAFIDSRQRDARQQSFRLSGAQFHGNAPMASCLVELDQPIGPDLWASRNGIKSRRRALRRLDPAKTTLSEFGPTQVFSDGLFSFADEPQKGVFPEPLGVFEFPVMANLEVKSGDMHFVSDFFKIVPKGFWKIPLRLTLSGDKLRMVTPGAWLRPPSEAGLEAIRDVVRPIQPGLNDPDDTVTLEVQAEAFMTAIDLVKAEMMRLDILAGPDGQPVALLLDAHEEEFRYRAAVMCMRPQAAQQ